MGCLQVVGDNIDHLQQLFQNKCVFGKCLMDKNNNKGKRKSDAND
jgi:hypothetical protein